MPPKEEEDDHGLCLSDWVGHQQLCNTLLFAVQSMALAGWPAVCPRYRVQPAHSATRPEKPMTHMQRWPSHRFLVRGGLLAHGQVL